MLRHFKRYIFEYAGISALVLFGLALFWSWHSYSKNFDECLSDGLKHYECASLLNSRGGPRLPTRHK